MSIYEHAIRPLLFRLDPERVHDAAILAGRALGSNPVTRGALSLLYRRERPILAQRIAGVGFRNPVGLAAGFDKNARLTRVLPSLGFGFAEVGSVTARAYGGNPRPRLVRLPEDRAIIVNYGLKSDGAIAVRKRLRGRHAIPIGVNVAATNTRFASDDDALDDWINGLRLLSESGDYLTINLSCPNTHDPRNWCAPEMARELIRRIESENLAFGKPVFLKLSADLATEDLDRIILLCRSRQWITGFIIANLVKERKGLRLASQHASRGGISGVPVMPRSLALVRRAYGKAGNRFVIIGCGGVFTAEDAYAYIRAGASLVQLVTGLIYGGPGTVKRINDGLARLFKRDGFRNVRDAVGADRPPS